MSMLWTRGENMSAGETIIAYIASFMFWFVVAYIFVTIIGHLLGV